MVNIISLSESAESISPEPLGIIRAEKYATFLNNLEKWVEATIMQNNINDENVIRRVKDSYRRSLQANIEYYDLMAKAMTDSGEKNAEKRYLRMAKVYRALIE
jgi:hypothetical protein